MTATTRLQREKWMRIGEIGCIICHSPCEIHHCFTGAGGRKNHDQVLPLCWLHHRSPQAGIHGMGRKAWQRIYGTEQELIDKMELMLQDG